MTTARGSNANHLGARKRGRPPGSKNKPKVGIDDIKSIQESIGPYLPQEDLSYLVDALEGRATPELERDVDIFLSLQLKALLPILADEIRTKQLSREATSRSGTVKELLAIRLQMEKMKAGNDGTDEKSLITNIFIARGIDPSRIAALTGATPRALPERVSGSPDGNEQEADETGNVPDEPAE